MKCNGTQIFCATMNREREQLSDRVTDWLRDNPQVDIVDIRTLQSSDSEFHCITIVVLYHGTAKQSAPRKAA